MKKPLRVRLCANQPSVVEVTVGDHVQLDQVIGSPHGTVAKRHGELLRPGTTQVALDAGSYMFRTLTDAHLRVVAGGVSVSRSVDPLNKGQFPLPPPRPSGSTSSDAPPDSDPDSRGDEPAGERPTLTVE